MTQEYLDIVEKLGEPRWYDALGFPRYCDFHPSKVADPYADYAALIEIQCQRCGKSYIVSKSQNVHTYGFAVLLPNTKGIGSFHYGDPPLHFIKDVCTAGYSMNSVPIRVIEFWHRDRNKDFKWVRLASCEVVISKTFRFD